MKKSKMRIYKRGRGYSDHMIDLFITVDSDCKNYLHIEMAHEDLRIPLTDISELMREKLAEANDELPEL